MDLRLHDEIGRHHTAIANAFGVLVVIVYGSLGLAAVVWSLW
jgi:hypothetical protein